MSRVAWHVQLGRWRLQYGYRRRPAPRPRRLFWLQRYADGDGVRSIGLWLFRQRVLYATWYSRSPSPEGPSQQEGE
jgi:hypothetical protein